MERDSKDDRKKIQEPFDPERTPEPAQVKDASNKEERETKAKEKGPSGENQEKKQPVSDKKPNESPVESDDKTNV